MDVSITPGAEFQQLRTRLRGAPATIRKELNRAIRAATAPAEADLKRAVLSLDSKGTRGGGGKQRGDASRARSKTGRLVGHTGLRRNVAKGITRKITYTGTRGGVRIRVDSKYLPESQKSLVRYMNSGKSFRHPVMGGNTWVSQQFTPKGWFDDTMKRHAPKVRQEIQNAARRALEQLQ